MNWPGETVLNRLIETVEKGVGGLLKPWQIRREGQANAEARAHEMVLLAKAETTVADIRAGRVAVDEQGKLIASSQKLLLPSPDAAEPLEAAAETQMVERFAQSAGNIETAQAIQRAINLKKTTLYAEEEAEKLDAEAREDAEGKKPQQPEDDWFARWRTGAQDVRKEEMQRLWAKLLVGEIAIPGSYSLHTVDFLSRMSPQDAKLLEKVAPFATDGGLLTDGEEVWESAGVTFSDLLYLDDLGLINGTTGLGGLSFSLGSNEWNGRKYSVLKVYDEALVFDRAPESDPASVLDFTCYPLTNMGKQILSLAHFVPSEPYLKRLAEVAVEKKGAIKVQRGKNLGTHITGLTTLAEQPTTSVQAVN